MFTYPLRTRISIACSYCVYHNVFLLNRFFLESEYILIAHISTYRIYILSIYSYPKIDIHKIKTYISVRICM